LQRKQWAEDEREISELRASQAERNDQERRKLNAQQMETEGQESNNGAVSERVDGMEIDRGPGNYIQQVQIKLEGQVKSDHALCFDCWTAAAS
jgi:hypothetical protein